MKTSWLPPRILVMTAELGGNAGAPLLTVVEAAELSGVHAKTIYRAIWAGKLKHLKVGALLRIRSADLVAYWAREV